MNTILVNQILEVNNKYAFSLAQAIRSEGINISVCGISGDDVSEYHIPFLGFFDSYSEKKILLSKVICYNNGYKKLTAYCKKNKIDVLHVQWYIFSPLDYLYLKKIKKNGTKIIVTIHDLLPFNKKIYDFFFHKKIYHMADEVISQNTSNIPLLKKEFGMNEMRIHYIPHGHFMQFAEFVPQEVAREHLRISTNKKVILFFGQIKKVKGLDILIRAMAQVKEKHVDAVCVIAGKVWKDDFSFYQKIIDELKLNDCIRTDIQYIPDEELKYYFCAADMVALPYRKIYQSGVVLLGYAYEKPIIATKEGEFVNIIKDKETGILVDSENVDALADSICWYLDHPNEANRIAIQGKKYIADTLSWNKIAHQIVELYQK